jgi:AraC-like DNA-binding protein/ligand-binding sensor protein
MKANSKDIDFEVFERLADSSLFRIYRRAFEDVTGMPLSLEYVEGDEEMSPNLSAPKENRFCRLLKGGANSCARCVVARKCLAVEARDQVRSVDCFAGLKETAVPVRIGKKTIAYLKTGQVFDHKPTKRNFQRLAKTLKGEGCSDKRMQQLEEAYFATPVVGQDRYQGMVTLLSAFGIQLAGLVNQIVLETQGNEPGVVTRAKQYIGAHLDEKLCLNDVAREVNVSSYYFCKLFKQATGMTFTEFVNRRRVECAKRKLLQPETRVTEVAYDVGYQSLSQFNRSFAKYAGESPTRFRERMKSQERGLAA